MNTEGRKVSPFCLQEIHNTRNYVCQIDACPYIHEHRAWLVFDDFHGCPTKGRGGGRGRIGGKIHRLLGEGGRKRNVTKFQPCHVQADIVQAEKLKRRENTVGNTFELSGTFKRLLVNVWEIEGKLRSRYFFQNGR